MKEKKGIWANMLEHPIATIIIIGVLCSCIVNIINAFKGNEPMPVIKMQIDLVETSGDK